MPKTLAELQAGGWERIGSATRRFQHWTGAVQGECVEILWDSETGRYRRVGDSGDRMDIARLAATLCMVLDEFLQAAPVTLISATRKAALRLALLEALEEGP